MIDTFWSEHCRHTTFLTTIDKVTCEDPLLQKAYNDYIATREAAYCCRPAPVEVRSLQGAGDAMVAGMCMALEAGLPLPEVLRHGVCLAGATVATEGTRPGTRADFERLLQCDLQMEKVR